MRSIRSMIALLVLSFLTVAATCTGPIPPVNLKLDDQDDIMPAGRVSFEVMPGNAQRRRGSLIELLTGAAAAGGAAEVRAEGATREDGRVEDGRNEDGESEDARRPPVRIGGEEAQMTFAIVGEFAMSEGGGDRGIPAGREAQLGVSIPGPAVADLDVDNRRGHLAARTGVRIQDMLSLEAIFGLGLDHTELELQSGGIEVRNGNVKPGFLLGGRATLRPIPLFDLYYQYTLNVIRSEVVSSGDTNTQEHLVGADLNLTRNVSVFGGYRWWHYSEEEMDSGSDADFEIEGPTVGVALKF